MRRVLGWAATVAVGAVVGVGAVAALDGAGQRADAQSATFRVTPAQLQTNQKISQAAVRRSNRALNYLAPVRTAQSDQADAGTSGVTALSAVPGSGQGWASGQIADGAITTGKIAGGAVTGPKVADGAVGEQKLAQEVRDGLPRWIVKVSNDMGVPVTRASEPGVTMTRLATGTYLADFGSDVRACAWTATPTVDSGVPAAQAARTMPDPGGSPNKVLAETFNGAGFLVDSGVAMQIVC